MSSRPCWSGTRGFWRQLMGALYTKDSPRGRWRGSVAVSGRLGGGSWIEYFLEPTSRCFLFQHGTHLPAVLQEHRAALGGSEEGVRWRNTATYPRH